VPTGDAAAVRVEDDGGDALLWVKAVPGASRDEVAGVVGDRLKVRVSAPPEGGKANKAVCRLLADALSVRRADVVMERGATSAEKVVRVCGVSAGRVREALR
jgi:uncharacterized protein (TIGR00251 family)